MVAQIAIPLASGVPGRSAPPQWWPGSNDPTTGFDPSFDDDTRWTGAYDQTIASGSSAPEASTRLLYSAGAQPYVYMTFESGYTPVTLNDQLYIGLADGSGNTLILQITFNESASTAASATTQPDDSDPAAPGPVLWGGTDTYVTVLAGITGPATTPDLTFSGTLSVPAWVATTLSVWIDNSGPRWMIALRVPVNGTAGAAINADAGPPLGSAFSFWYEYDVNISTGPNLMVPLTGSAPFNQDTANLIVRDIAGILTFPAASLWPKCTLGGSSTSDGVALVSGNIGTVYPTGACGGSVIQYSNTNAVPPPTSQPENYFYAAPTFNSTTTGATIAAGQITATFRLADWGSVSAQAGWSTIGTATNAGVIAAGQTASVPTAAPPAAGSYTCALLTWNASTTAPTGLGVPPGTSWATAISNNLLDSHECCLVDLSSTNANIVFSNNSVVRNMDFVSTSTFTRDATVDVRGLTPFSSEARDVFLALQVSNMTKETIGPPTKVNIDLLEEFLKLGGGKNFPRSVTSFAFDGTPATLVQLAQRALQNRPPPRALTDILPSWNLHCYHDTGKRFTRNGQEVVILGLSTAFGYYPIHIGSVSAWNWRIDGATRLGEYLWVIPVPNNGAAKINTTIQAQGPGEVPITPQPIVTNWGNKCGPPPKQLVDFLEGVVEVANWLLCKLKNS